jgi:hypothetical protein
LRSWPIDKNSWGQVAKLTAADGVWFGLFGISVSVDGSTAVVGASSADVGGNDEQGATYVYYRDQGGADAWGQFAELAASDGAASDYLGYSVSVDGSTAIAGAVEADGGDHPKRGAAYVYYPPYALPAVHLNALLLRWAAGADPGTYIVRAYARVHDQVHALAPGVRVNSQRARPDGSKQNQTKVTAANGVAVFTLGTTQTGTFRFCVGNLVKAGYTYTPAANETPACQAIVVGQ